jgi:hypothetical protein
LPLYACGGPIRGNNELAWDQRRVAVGQWLRLYRIDGRTDEPRHLKGWLEAGRRFPRALIGPGLLPLDLPCDPRRPALAVAAQIARSACVG